MTGAPTLAVQIVNYRTRSYLERCLASVLADLDGDDLRCEINLLDNASGESLDDLAAASPQVTASTAERNLGFGAGHNRLAAMTEAQYLWFLNPDVELCEPDTVRRLLQAISASDRVRAVGPRLLAADGRPQPYDHGRLRGARAGIASRGGHSYWRATDVRRRVAWTSGAALLVERAAFVALGGFDAKLFLYKEEEDLCLRLRGAGGEVLYDPEVSVRHTGTVVADRSRWAAESERYFIAKHCRPGPVQQLAAAVHHGLAYVHL
jgi:N-acetylglucosaminyl-diphospho-decaprenol L-rhamnosyltransferase